MRAWEIADLLACTAPDSPPYGWALRQGQEALAFAGHTQSSGLFVPGLSLDRASFDVPLGHALAQPAAAGELLAQ